jgi:hypothetical protein
MNEYYAKLCELTAETITLPSLRVEKHWYGNKVLNDIYVSLEVARKEQLLTMAKIIRNCAKPNLGYQG